RRTHIRRILRQLLRFLHEYPPVIAMGESSNIDVTPSITGVLGRIQLIESVRLKGSLRRAYARP
ncbi:hypothetical protein, partial [Caballeronia sp. GACF5]|uniref:hypothetical protein n=1 Tax=Caballeronia sp. GACF5 TaxID=2921746 RepID=UPI002028E382